MKAVVTMDDFFPPRPVTLEDFYPNGIVPGYRVPSRRFTTGAGEVLLALTKRLQDSADAERELLTIMEFCHGLLKTCGVDFEIRRLVKGGA